MSQGKVYTGYHDTSEIEHGLCACTVDNPLAKARELPLRTSAQTMLYLSLVARLHCVGPFSTWVPFTFCPKSEINDEQLFIIRWGRVYFHMIHQNFYTTPSITRLLFFFFFLPTPMTKKMYPFPAPTPATFTHSTVLL